MADRLGDGLTFRLLNVLDDFRARGANADRKLFYDQLRPRG